MGAHHKSKNIKAQPAPPHKRPQPKADVQDGKLRQADILSRKTKKNQARGARRDKALAAQTAEREKRHKNYKEILHATTGIPEADIHIHELERQSDLVDLVHKLEELKKEPLREDWPEFHDLQFHSFYEPGLHLMLDAKTKKLVMALRIQPWSSMRAGSAKVLKRVLNDVVLAHSVHYKCTSNAAQKGSAVRRRLAHIKKEVQKRRQQAKVKRQPVRAVASKIPPPKPAKTPKRSRRSTNQAFHSHRRPRNNSKPDPIHLHTMIGLMTTVAWHGAQEDGKTIVISAPKTNVKPGSYRRVKNALPSIAQLYCRDFISLAPIAAKEMIEMAEEFEIPCFSADDLHDILSLFFANSLSVSSRWFANWSHTDFDQCLFSYGKNFMTRRIRKPVDEQKYAVDESVDHSLQQGGAFLVVPYAIKVDYARMGRSVSDMFWRGDLEHLTMQTLGPVNPDVMRHGSSIQITEKGVNALETYREKGDPTRATTSSDRLHNLEARQS